MDKCPFVRGDAIVFRNLKNDDGVDDKAMLWIRNQHKKIGYCIVDRINGAGGLNNIKLVGWAGYFRRFDNWIKWEDQGKLREHFDNKLFEV